jgi:hypothetical protein
MHLCPECGKHYMSKFSLTRHMVRRIVAERETEILLHNFRMQIFLELGDLNFCVLPSGPCTQTISRNLHIRTCFLANVSPYGVSVKIWTYSACQKI